MIGHAKNRIGIESVLGRQLHTLIGRVDLIRETDTVTDLRAELEPSEIEVTAETYFAEIVGEVHQNGFVPVSAHIETRSSTCNDVWAVVTFTFCRPFEVQWQINGHSQHVNMIAEFTGCTLNRIARFGLVTDGSTGELHSRTEPQIQVTAQTQVGHKTYVESRQDTAYARMENLLLAGDRIGGDGCIHVRNTVTGEVHTQLKPEVEEFIVHIGPVLRLLSEQGSTKYRIQSTNQ